MTARRGVALSTSAALAAGILAGCSTGSAQSLPAWKAVSLPMICSQLSEWVPESATDLRANEAFARLMLAMVPRVDAADRVIVDEFARAQSAYAQALANEPDVFAVRLRALARSRAALDTACEEAATPVGP